jgi:hypothetical protein
MILKNVMNVPLYCLSSELYNALTISFTNEHILKNQLKFLIRAQLNEYTAELTKNLMLNENSNGLVNHIKKKLEIKNYEELQSKCQNEIDRLDTIASERLSHCRISKTCQQLMKRNIHFISNNRNKLIANLLHYANK